MDRKMGMAIGEVSRRTGCTIETIRYHERIGLLPPPARRGRYRLYGGEDLRRLAFVLRARELGFTLDNVRALLGLTAGGQDACAAARRLAATHLADGRAKIADLRVMECALAATIRHCDVGEVPGCALIDSLSARAPLV